MNNQIKWKNKTKNDHAKKIFDDLSHYESCSDKTEASLHSHNARLTGYELPSLIIANMICFDNVLQPNWQLEVTRKTIINLLESGKLDCDSFIEKLNELTDEELLKEEKVFHVLTDLSIDQPLFTEVSINGVTLRLLKNAFDTKFVSRKNAVISAVNRANLCWSEDCSEYKRVLITCKARHFDAAYIKSIEALDILRGYMNVLAIPQFQDWHPDNIPIARIQTGPVTTIHDSEGKLVLSNGAVYFNYDFIEKPSYIYRDKDLIENFESDVKWFLKKLTSLSRNYSNILRSSLLLYIDAIDERNPSTSILKMWGALEQLTCNEKANYDQLINRTSFTQYEKNLTKIYLNGIKESRNKIVHQGGDCAGSRHAEYYLARHFADLIKFHLNHGTKFNTFDEATAVLNLPTDEANLFKKQTQLDCAKDYLGFGK